MASSSTPYYEEMLYIDGRWKWATIDERALYHRQQEEKSLYPSGVREEPWAPHVQEQFTLSEPVRPGCTSEKADLWMDHKVKPGGAFPGKRKAPKGAKPGWWLSTKRAIDYVPLEEYCQDEVISTPLGDFPAVKAKKVTKKKKSNKGPVKSDMAELIDLTQDWEYNDVF